MAKVIKREWMAYKVDGEMYPRIQLAVEVVETADGIKTRLVDETGWDGFDNIRRASLLEVDGDAFDTYWEIATAWVTDSENDTATPIIIPYGHGVPRGAYIYKDTGSIARVRGGERYDRTPLPWSAVINDSQQRWLGGIYYSYAIDREWEAEVVKAAIGLLNKQQRAFGKLKRALK